jgi:hypothetical protein
MKLRMLAVAMVGLAMLATAANAQQKRVSPADMADGRVGGKVVAIYYCRPYTKDPKTGEPRKIWGGLVPYDKVWRTGANEATLLVTQAPLQFGDTTVPAGAYTVWTIPTEDGGKFIINKQIGQWGEGSGVYDEANDVVRVDMKKETVDSPLNQFAISIQSKRGSDDGVIKLAWENTAYTVPFKLAK